MDLNKKDKKVARELIAKGMHKEFDLEMEKFDAILRGWRTEGINAQEHYHKLYAAVIDFNKHIARRYDYLPSSTYISTVGAQVVEKLIDRNELDSLSPEAREEAMYIVRFHENNL